MNIDNDRLFCTEDIDRVEEMYEDDTESFSEHTYENKHYAKLFRDLWGENYKQVFCNLYKDNFEEFKKDYEFEYLEYIGKE